MKTTDKRKREILESLRGGLVVSCQVQPEDPIYTKDMAVKMAEAAKWAGAVGIRANTPEQIRQIREAVQLPVIGLYKIWNEDTGVYITPPLEAAKAVWEAGADIIAMDCTGRLTHEKTIAWRLLPQVKEAIPEAITFADVSNYAAAKRAVERGADIGAPTLCGYTDYTQDRPCPDYREFARMCRDFGQDVYMMMEGHLNTPEDAMKCMYLGAHAVVVGSAITRPHLTAKRFVDLLRRYEDDGDDTSEQ